MPETGWIEVIKESLTTETATWFVGLLIAILSLFSSRITESIKFALNRADLRTNQHEEFAVQVSQYIFSAELNTEFIENDWTTKTTMTALLTQYNESIGTLRKKEFVYLAWTEKYWGKEEATKFKSFMASVREFDATIHALNDEFEAVNLTGKKEKIDRKRAEEALKVMKPAVENMRKQGRAFLKSIA